MSIFLKRIGAFIFITIFTVVLCFISISCNPEEDVTVELPDYWPTQGWQATSPEKQGMDSGLLADMVEIIRTQYPGIRSFLVIRNGYLVVEAYFHPFRQDFRHIIHSCTKSITSTLVGIARDRGSIADLDLKILDTFSDYPVQNPSTLKNDLCLRHLLMMATGLDAQDSYLYNWKGLDEMKASTDWAQYVLNLPMITAPGERFDYSNCASYLIAAVLHRKTDTDGLTYANQYLFSPLGIENVEWEKSPQGIVQGQGSIRMKPSYMAKFGFLFLHEGQWENSQVVSKEWVQEATRAEIHAGTMSDDYGYQWWIEDDGYYMALGYGGQYIIVYPDENLVTVITSALNFSDYFMPKTLFHQYILASIQSDESMDENPVEKERLAEAIHLSANPVSEPVPSLTATALAVSGRKIIFHPNPLDYKFMALTFTSGSNQSIVELAYRNKHYTVSVGMDNVYRLTLVNDWWRAYRGTWESKNTYALDYQVADYTERITKRLTFNGDTVQISLDFPVTGSHYEFSGYLQ
jgi:CubicO group peptidase (beta-lactamase class C family)